MYRSAPQQIKMPCLRLSTVCKIAAALAGALLPFSSLQAHPHSWIDVTSTVILERNSIAAVKQQWTFDAEYSRVLLKEVGRSDANLKTFAETSLLNLAEHSYFTRLKGRLGAVPFARPHGSEAQIVGGERLRLSFTLPLQSAIPRAGASLTLSVYDPTFYIEMRHGSSGGVLFVGNGENQCDAVVHPADPPKGARERALEMDRQVIPDFTLGEKFAEVVNIHCR